MAAYFYPKAILVTYNVKNLILWPIFAFDYEPEAKDYAFRFKIDGPMEGPTDSFTF